VSAITTDSERHLRPFCAVAYLPVVAAVLNQLNASGRRDYGVIVDAF